MIQPQFQAALFDLDGVITSTTHQHFEAWQKKIKEHFDIDVDPSLETLTRGVSRYDSLKILLNSYDIHVDEITIQKIATEKNELYLELIRDFDQSNCLEGIVELLNLLKTKGFKIALCSASKNGPSLLKSLNIEHFFDLVVDPSTGPGKPHPFIFLEAAKLLNVHPKNCLGFEDAISGVSALIDAGIYTIGVGSEPLHQANVQVTSLTYINEEFINSLESIDHGLDPQVLSHDDKVSIEDLKVDETLFSLSNGIIGYKGSFSEGYGNNDDVPQTFINGFYNNIPYHYEENSIHFPQEGQTMINVLDGSVMHVYINDKQVDMTHSVLKSLKRKYFLHEGKTWREAIYETDEQHLITIIEERLVSTKFRELIVTKLTVASNHPNDKLTLVSKIRLPQVKNTTSLDPRLAKSLKHLTYESSVINENFASIRAKTNASQLSCELGMTHNLRGELVFHNEEIIEQFVTNLNQTFTITKYCVLKGSHLNDDVCTMSQLRDLQPFSYYETLQRSHFQQFVSQHRLTTSSQAMNLALHFNLTHLYGSGGVDPRIQIGAKGISGEGYEGHYFWDTEIYMLPFFAFTHPQHAKNLIAFRYHTLDKAKEEARKLGVERGAKIPWRTINGKEASPYYPAGSAQVHINSDIAYAINQIYVLTHDDDFMQTIGFELMLETAIFLLDYGHFNSTGFHLDGVTGPDEYTAIVNDNAYTNMMAKFHFERVVQLSQNELNIDTIHRCGYTLKDIEDLNEAALKIVIHFDKERHIIAQDSTFLSKKMLDVSRIPLDKKPMLLHYHPLYIYKHQVLKQADTVLGCVLLPLENQEIFEKTLHYYLNLTTHDSSLSKAMYGIAAYRLNDATLGKDAFDDVLKIDLRNARKHTQHGLHMANIGGSYLLVMYGLFGCVVKDEVSFNPRPLVSFDFVSTRIQIQGVVVDLRLERDLFSLKSEAKISCRVGQDMVTLIPNQWTMIKVV